MKSWTFTQEALRTRATLKITIGSEWVLVFTILDKHTGQLIDQHTFTLNSIWVAVIKATML